MGDREDMSQKAVGENRASTGPSGLPRQRWIKVVVAVSLVGFCAVNTRNFVKKVNAGKSTLKIWLPCAAEIGRDELLYTHHRNYIYPPWYLVVIRPLTYVSRTAAAIIWQMMKYAAVGAIFWLVWDLLSRDGPLPTWAKLGSVVMSARFILNDLGHGNVNLFICLLVVLAVWLLARGRLIACGVAVAVAACIKITPALWAVYLLYKRQWRALVGVVIGVVICLELVPLMLLSPAMNHALLRRWYAHVITPYVSKGQVYSTRINQSMAGVTNRLLGRSEWAPRDEPIALVDLDDETLKWVQRGIGFAVIAMLAWFCRGALPEPDRLALAVEWSLVAATTLVLSGYTWTGHFCLLILAHVAVLAYLARRGEQRIDRQVLVLTIIALALCSLTSDLITPAGRRWAAAVGLMLYGVLALAAALVLIRERRRPSAVARDSTHSRSGRGGSEGR